METAQRNRPSPRPSPVEVPGNGHSQHPRAHESGIELTSAMSFCEAGHAVLGYHLSMLLASESGARSDEDHEAIHRMRVATRRLFAALRDFRAAFSDEELDPFIADVRWLGRLLGKLRDLDVFIDWLRSIAQDVPTDMLPYVRRIVQDRETVRVGERAALLTALNSDRYRYFVRAFSRFVQSDAGNAHCDQDALVGLAVGKIESELRRVRRKSRGANMNHLKRLHRLRIEAKRLRYTAEFFGSLFPGRLDKIVQRARRVQDDLGRVHDATIHRQFLKEMRRTQSGDPKMRKTLTELMSLLEQNRADAYKRFRKHFKRLGTKQAQRKLSKQLKQVSQG